MRTRSIRFSFFIICSLITLSGCFKTTEDIARDERIDAMIIQAVDNQKLLAEQTLQNQDLQAKVAMLSGAIEDTQHVATTSGQERNNNLEATLQQITAQLETVQNKLNELNSQVAANSRELTEHRQFIRGLTKSLKIPTKQETSHDNPLINEALTLYKKKDYKSAKKIFLMVLNDKKASQSEKNQAYFHMGFIEYRDKNYQDSIIYFSKIYTKWPKSSYAPASIFQIGKALVELKEIEQAQASFEEVLNKYPKSKQAKLAKSEIKKLK